MCYDIKTSLESQLKRARFRGNINAIKEIEEKLQPYRDNPFYHISGFQHPKLLIYTKNAPIEPVWSYWGLIPHWTKDTVQAKKTWNNTLNARGETIFEKPSFKNSAIHKRCIVFIDGFYEHHHYNGHVYPFFISLSNNTPIALGGLWSEWIDTKTGQIINTFTIVTTRANLMLTKIHNNPKLKEPRMPLILNPDEEDIWLNETVEKIEKIIKPLKNGQLVAHTVNRLRGRNYLGNVKEVSEPFKYEELVF